MAKLFIIISLFLGVVSVNQVVADQDDTCLDLESVADIVAAAVEGECGDKQENDRSQLSSRTFFLSRTRCTTDADCGDGQRCRPFFRVCANLRATGALCTSDAQCASGTCNLTNGIFLSLGRCA